MSELKIRGLAFETPRRRSPDDPGEAIKYQKQRFHTESALFVMERAAKQLVDERVRMRHMVTII